MREQKVHEHYFQNWNRAKPKQMLENIKTVPTQAGAAVKWLGTGFDGNVEL